MSHEQLRGDTIVLIASTAMLGVQDLIPLMVFAGVVVGIFAVMNMLAERNARSQERLQRYSRPQSLADIEDLARGPKKTERFQAVADMAASISQPLMPQTELEQSALRV